MTKEQFELLLDAWAEKVKLAFDHETMLNREQ